MQSAEAVVDILRARGRRGLPCGELYRQLFNPALFLMFVDRTTRRHAGDGGCAGRASNTTDLRCSGSREAVTWVFFRAAGWFPGCFARERDSW